MSSSIDMEAQDLIGLKNAEIASLREELVRERARREAAEAAEELAIAAGLRWQRSYAEARAQLQSWADHADQIAQRGGMEL